MKKNKRDSSASKKVSDKKSCFIIMPFTRAAFDDKALDHEDLYFIYQNFIRKAIESYKAGKVKVFDNIRRNESQVGSIINDIVSQLNEYDLVIADLTGVNPNVMYELGVRHSLRRGTIIISQDIKSIPSDLRDYMLVQYKYSAKTIQDNRNYQEFETNIHKAIEEIFSTKKYDSPVLSYLKGKERYWRDDELKLFWKNVTAIEYLYRTYNWIRTLDPDGLDDDNASIHINLISVQIGHMQSTLGDLNISVEVPTLYEDLITAENLLSEISKNISMSTSLPEVFSSLPIPSTDLSMIQEGDLLRMKNVLTKQYLNGFLLKEGKIGYISIKDVFWGNQEFKTRVLDALVNYIEKKSLELGIPEEETFHRMETIQKGN